VKLVVACVPKEYDLNKIEKAYPDSAIYVTTKTESEDKVKEQLKRNQYIVFDSDHMSDVTKSQLDYAKTLSNKNIVDLKEIIND